MYIAQNLGVKKNKYTNPVPLYRGRSSPVVWTLLFIWKEGSITSSCPLMTNDSNEVIDSIPTAIYRQQS